MYILALKVRQRNRGEQMGTSEQVEKDGIFYGWLRAGRYQDRPFVQWIAVKQSGEQIGAWGDKDFAEFMLSGTASR